MNGSAAGVTCKGTGVIRKQLIQADTFDISQTCLWQEGKPSPMGEKSMGWKAIFSLLSLSRSQRFKAQGSWFLLSTTPSTLSTLTPCASSCASSSFSSSLLPCCLLTCALPSCLYHSQSLSCQSQMTSCLYVSFSSFPSFFF